MYRYELQIDCQKCHNYKGPTSYISNKDPELFKTFNKRKCQNKDENGDICNGDVIVTGFYKKPA
ncbi:MAG: hypothetical protein ABFC34_03955 [Methanobacterium sp.]